MKTILIVEDDEANMKLFHDLLEAEGYRILVAGDGIEAVRLAKTQRPDLIVMDIKLPKISGLDAIAQIREDETLTTVPVVAVTAFAMKGDEERIMEKGYDFYMAKPVSVKYFLENIRRFIK